jgi:hypothetical protein
MNGLSLHHLSRKTEGIGPVKSWQPIPVGATSYPQNVSFNGKDKRTKAKARTFLVSKEKSP